jgi:hypothetical protein
MTAFCPGEPVFVRSGISERTAQPIFGLRIGYISEDSGWQNPTVAPKRWLIIWGGSRIRAQNNRDYPDK